MHSQVMKSGLGPLPGPGVKMAEAAAGWKALGLEGQQVVDMSR